MKFQQKHLLLLPGFLLALLLLLLNDFYLKYAFPSWTTGKLSDFCGLFVFGIFWIALFGKHRKLILSICALAFIFWKSPASQGIINTWNVLPFYSINRVVDYSDCIAILSLVFAYFYSFQKRTLYPQWALSLSACLAFFAFAATSYQNPTETRAIGKTYEIQLEFEQVIERLNAVSRTSYCQKLFFDSPIALADTQLFDHNFQANIYVNLKGIHVRRDTIYKYNSFTNRPTNRIDTIYVHRFPEYDTLYIEEEIPFVISYPDSSGRTCEKALVVIDSSSIQLLELRDLIFQNRNERNVPPTEETRIINKAIRSFEQNIIRRLQEN